MFVFRKVFNKIKEKSTRKDGSLSIGKVVLYVALFFIIKIAIRLVIKYIIHN